MCKIEGETKNPIKMKFLETTVKFLVVHWFAACQDIHPEVKYELFHLTLPTMKNRHSLLGRTFGIWKITYATVECETSTHPQSHL